MFTFADPRTDALARALREHPEGLSFQQIATAISPRPPTRTLYRWIGKLVFAGLITRRGKTNRARYLAGKGRVALPVKKRQPKPPPARKPEPPAPPARPARVVRQSTLPPEFQPVFDAVAPGIIRTGYGDDTAIDVLARAAVLRLHADTDLMNEFVEAAMTELDSLDRDTALTKYHVQPEEWDDWRKEWCSLRGL